MFQKTIIYSENNTFLHKIRVSELHGRSLLFLSLVRESKFAKKACLSLGFDLASLGVHEFVDGAAACACVTHAAKQPTLWLK
jgi:hypothetical protein